jgi:hypothetical protein
MTSRAVWTLVGVAAVASMTGCGQASDRDGADPGTVAKGFSRALAAGDGAQACSLLAPQTRSQLEQSAGTGCAAAIAEEDLPDPGAVRRVSVFGTMAQVRFTEDVWFLAEFRTGWRVLASGCAPVPDQPYDCQLEGG